MDPNFGVDVLHMTHHSSESSTAAEYYNLVKPEVGLISLGLNQGRFRHPRKDVADPVLIGAQASCVSWSPLRKLFQMKEGVDGESATGETSFTGKVLGDIKLVTDGKKDNRISGTGRVGLFQPTIRYRRVQLPIVARDLLWRDHTDQENVRLSGGYLERAQGVRGFVDHETSSKTILTIS